MLFGGDVSEDFRLNSTRAPHRDHPPIALLDAAGVTSFARTQASAPKAHHKAEWPSGNDTRGQWKRLHHSATRGSKEKRELQTRLDAT